MRRALLDTNVIIWREAARSPRADIGLLFFWLDKLHVEKVVHPTSLEEISRYHDQHVVAAVQTRAQSYVRLQTIAPLSPQLKRMHDDASDQNSKIDIILLNEVACGRVDLLITEDKGLRDRAKKIGLAGVFSIAEFIADAADKAPKLPDYKIPTIQKILIGELNFSDPFFNSLRDSYPGFDRWLHRKADEYAYVLNTDFGIGAFLYLKFEDENERYSDLQPQLPPARRMKIGTFKVTYNGFRVGERLLHIAFDAAMGADLDQIYVTMKTESEEQLRLQKLLVHWGFSNHGKKISSAGEEQVYTRDVLSKGSFSNVFHQYPRVKKTASFFIVPIYPEYHTELFPESILRTEIPGKFVEQAPHRNGIAKSYISRSLDRSAMPGDTLLFYRTADRGTGWHTSVVTTLALVENLVTDIPTFEAFAHACRRRSLFTDEELLRHWNWAPKNRPFVVHLLHSQSFPRRPNRKTLVNSGLIPEAPPRGLTRISFEQFQGIVELGGINERLIVD